MRFTNVISQIVQTLGKDSNGNIMDFESLVCWLKESDEEKLASLWKVADEVRREYVGDAIHLRGLIEISNHCFKNCYYCGIRRGNKRLLRYRMTVDEIMETAKIGESLGYGTVVLQSGEDPDFPYEEIARIIEKIKSETGLAVTLSLGEKNKETLKLWRQAGADRYLLKFETSDHNLFKCLHKGDDRKDLQRRIELLIYMRELGYEIGSGIIVGLPGQTYESVAKDILKFKELDLDMVGIGPYVPHPYTPLGKKFSKSVFDEKVYVPNTPEMTLKVIALTRIVCPESNIPATTALATVGGVEARKLALTRGANVIMPNITPQKYKVCYDIYPGKSGVRESIEEIHSKILKLIADIGRVPGIGKGNRIRRDKLSPVGHIR